MVLSFANFHSNLQAAGISRAWEEAENLRKRQTDEEGRRMCTNIQRILDVVLCRNKLDRPRAPSPPPPPPALVYTRRRPRGGAGSSSQGTSSQNAPVHEEFVPGPSQPMAALPSSSTARRERSSSNSSSSSSRPLVTRRQRRSPREFHELHD